MLERVPAHFQVIRHVRVKLACRGCERIVQAAAPSRPIERSIAGQGLLAHVLVSKFGDHLPLYRQSEIYAREGVELDRSTLADWVGASSRLLEPLVEVLRRHVMSAEKLHADDTPVPVLAPGLGKTKTGRLWAYARDDRPSGDETPPAVWFAYTLARKGEHPKVHLSNFRGLLQADAYAGFDPIYEAGGYRKRPVGRTCAGNFTIFRLHMNLRWHRKHFTGSENFMPSKQTFADESPKNVARYANERSRPLLESLKQWLEETLGKLSRKSDTSQAVRYALGRWEALMR